MHISIATRILAANASACRAQAQHRPRPPFLAAPLDRRRRRRRRAAFLVQVADYGLAHTSEVMLGAHERAKGSSSKRRAHPTLTTLRANTLRWMAPELLQPSADGVDPFTEASDVYR